MSKTFQVLNSSFQCVEKLCIFIILMIVNNIITTIMGIKGKVNTVMKLMAKESLWNTKIKQKIVHFRKCCRQQ